MGLAGQFNCKQIEACKCDCGSWWMWLLGYTRIDSAEEITEIKNFYSMLIDLQQSAIVQIVYQYALKDVVTVTAQICEWDLVKTCPVWRTRLQDHVHNPSRGKPALLSFTQSQSITPATSSLVPLSESHAPSHILPLVTSFYKIISTLSF